MDVCDDALLGERVGEGDGDAVWCCPMGLGYEMKADGGVIKSFQVRLILWKQ